MCVYVFIVEYFNVHLHACQNKIILLVYVLVSGFNPFTTYIFDMITSLYMSHRIIQYVE